MTRAALSIMLVGLVACGSDDSGTYLVVTVSTRPAVHDAKTIKVKLTNEGSERSDDLTLTPKGFPATFSVSAPGRTGDLGISVEAIDADGLLVGRGETTTTIESPTAEVMVDSADFVVNTDFADDQLLSNYSPANGFQLAAVADGTWTAVHSAACDTPCNIYGRRFDPNGRPVSSQAAAGTNAFPVTTRLTSFWSTPTAAANSTTTVVVWNHDVFPDSTPPAGTPGYAIDCRAFDTTGMAVTNQLTIAPDDLPFLTSVSPMSNGNFAVVWDGRPPAATTTVIRSGIAKPDCSVLAGSQLTVSTVTGTASPHGSHSANSADRILYTWLLDSNVRARVATLSNTFITADSLIVSKTATERPEHVRVAPLPGGNFAIFTRWALISGSTGPGRIEMSRANNAGTIMGPPVVVTTRSGSDFASSESFGVAAHTDGSILVVWSSCLANGDDSGCGVFGRLMSSTGSPIGPEFSLATTTKDDQVRPAAVALPGTPTSFATAWTDKSQLAPDTAGASVRARIVYPPTDGGQ